MKVVLTWGVVAASSALLWGGRAEAACGKPEKAKIAGLRGEGTKAYDDLDMEVAKSAFKKAIEVAKKAGCTTKDVAKVYLRLGVIYKVADLDEGLAIKTFKSALEIDPDVELDRDVSTPEVDSVLKKARSAMGSSGSSGSSDKGKDDGATGDDGSDDVTPPPPPPTKVKKAAEEKNLACFAMRDGGASMCVDSEVEMKVQCESTSDLGAATMSYRVDGGPWVPNEMVGAGGFFGTTVSAASIKGKRIEFYVDGTDAKGKRAAWGGTSEAPYSVKIGCKKVASLDDGASGDPPEDHVKKKKDPPVDDADKPPSDDEDPLGTGDGEDGEEDKPAKPKGPSKPLGRIFSFYLNLGTGLGLSTSGGTTQINHSEVRAGTMWAPIHLEPEIDIHIPLKSKIGIAFGVYSRLQLSPIFAWQLGARGRVFVPLSEKFSIVINAGFGWGPVCKTIDAMVNLGCRGGATYLIPTPMSAMNPLDYVIAGPFSFNVGVGGQLDFSRYVGLYFGLDLGAFIGSAGFAGNGDPLPSGVQPHMELNVGVRFGN
jgi:hypothetical protein